MLKFITNRIKSFGYAFKGIYLLVTTEANFQFQFAVAIGVTILGFVVTLTPTEWILQNTAIAMVLATEGVNTAIEKIADFIHPEHNNKIGFIKDIAAAAVLITAIAAFITGCIIYLPKFF